MGKALTDSALWPRPAGHPSALRADVLEPDDIGSDPGDRVSGSRESAVRDDIIAFGDDELVS